MQQPEPIKLRGAYISDHSALVDFGNAIQYIGGSILKLREAVDGYFKAVESAMEKKIEEVRRMLSEAERELSQARQALSACRSRRYYDSEKERWVEPNCSCEERDVKDAEKEVRRLEKMLNKLERIKSETDAEFSEYRKPYGAFAPGGGDSVLEWLGESHTKSAIERMDAIMDVVKKYLKASMRKDGGTLPDTDAFPLAMDKESHEKAEKFRAASQRVLDMQREANFGNRALNDANAIPLCSKCGRPTPIACICQRPPLEYERLYNYDLSR